eukprot:TRINITY_DN13518_c0_g1_i1.p1 TRINITY_DN13518_c0_g1~~TRINITY_DN13518_c0_g1_i1.p1  ORF type:complete len:665 (+),score=154.27 TRINITY_DN13518_c0_g1_i1:51-2045(+)
MKSWCGGTKELRFGTVAWLVSLLAVLSLPAIAIKAQRRSGVHPNVTPLFSVQVAFKRAALDKFKGLTATMDNVTNSIKVVNAIEEKNGAAWARLADRMEETGWMELHVDTPEEAFFTNDMKVYCAGLLEGLLTAERMSQFYSNFYPLLQPDQNSSLALMNIRSVFHDELEYIMRQAGLQSGVIDAEPAEPYWKQMRYLLVQMWGLKDAYNMVAEEKGVRKISMMDMFFINSHAELPELIQAYAPAAVKSREAFQQTAPVKKMEVLLQQNSSAARRGEEAVEVHAEPRRASKEELRAAEKDWKLRLAKHGHCSALVRLGNRNSDIYVGHSTWSDYSKMLRIYKYYNFHLPLSLQSNKLVAFSSYPGCVSSTDDFYMMDNGLTVMDTTLELLNTELYDRIPEFPNNPRIPKFMHVMSVNRVAKTGPQWTTMYGSRNLGTGNSQWIVVDYNRFLPGKRLGENTIRLLEQVPGITQQADISSQLESRGYWGGYNRPFFEVTRRMSGHEKAEATFGALYSFEDAPRANIMKRVGLTVSSLKDMRSAMTHNDGKDAPPAGTMAAGAGNAIMARLDLDASVGNIPNGGIDAKVTSACLMKKMACQAISGPSHASRNPFRWKSEAKGGAVSADLFQGWPHLGLPDVYDFDYVEMSPVQDKKASSTLTESNKC